MAKNKSNTEAESKKTDNKNLTPEQKKAKALETAIAQIEKDFGKGAIMKLGEASESMHVEAVPTGRLAACRWTLPLVSAAFRREGLLKCMVLSRVERQRSPSTWWQRFRSAAASPDSSMQNTPWIRFTQRISVWISTISTFPSRIPESRLLRSQMQWSDPER